MYHYIMYSTILYFNYFLSIVLLMACLVSIIHSQHLHILLTSLQLYNVFKHLNSVTAKKYIYIYTYIYHCNSLLKNLTPISARKLKMKQTYDLSDEVVVMELEQISMNVFQQSIEERQNKYRIQSKKGHKKD